MVGKSLKAQNAWLIHASILFHLAAFVWIVAGAPPVATVQDKATLMRLQSSLAPGALSLALIVIVGLVLRGVLPSAFRDRLVHLRWHDPLPGARAFTVIGPRDPRVNMRTLRARYGPLPTKPSAQNPKFYSIYQQYRDAVPVLDAHRSYLAARDLATITYFFALALPLGAWATTGDGRTSFYYGLALLACAILLSQAAKTYGRRLVENTLSLASQT